MSSLSYGSEPGSEETADCRDAAVRADTLRDTAFADGGAIGGELGGGFSTKSSASSGGWFSIVSIGSSEVRRLSSASYSSSVASEGRGDELCRGLECGSSWIVKPGSASEVVIFENFMLYQQIR